MDIQRIVKEMTFKNNSILAPQTPKNLIPSYYGIQPQIVKRKPLEIKTNHDENGCVPLMHLKYKNFEIIEIYQNKSPIILINFQRLEYTKEILEFLNEKLPEEKAIALMIEYEVGLLNKLKPNERISTLIHRLQKIGDYKYWMFLAHKYKLNVDYINQPNFAYRYTQIEFKNWLTISTLCFLYVIITREPII